MRKVLLILILLLFFYPAGVMAGPSAGSRQQQRVEIGKDVSMGVEKTKEKRKQKGKRREIRIDTGITKATEKALHRQMSLRKNKDLVVEMSFQDLIMSVMVELEKKNKKYSSCSLFSNPPVLSSIGINFEIEPGMIDLTKMEYWKQQAIQHGVASPSVVNYKVLNQIINCSFEYAIIIGSALLKLEDTMKSLSGWAGIQDLRKWIKTILYHNMVDPGIKNMLGSIKSLYLTPCRFYGDIHTLKCGGILVSFSPFSVRTVQGFEIFGHKFAGLGGSWRVSSAFSLDQAFQTICRYNKSNNYIKTVARYVEDLESKGKIKRAALIKKKVINQAMEGHISINLSPNPLE